MPASQSTPVEIHWSGPNPPLQSTQRKSRTLLSFSSLRALCTTQAHAHLFKALVSSSCQLICDSYQMDAWLMYKLLACCLTLDIITGYVPQPEIDDSYLCVCMICTQRDFDCPKLHTQLLMSHYSHVLYTICFHRADRTGSSHYAMPIHAASHSLWPPKNHCVVMENQNLHWLLEPRVFVIPSIYMSVCLTTTCFISNLQPNCILKFDKNAFLKVSQK